MTALAILLWPDPRLSQRCAELGAGPGACKTLETLETLVGDMLQTMYEANGRGLAAPQVGQMIRLFVMDTGWKAGDMRPMVCIDPEVVSVSEAQTVLAEGCLSIPGVVAEVTRPETITLEYTDLTGLRCRAVLEGADARCAQHELDHLDGKVHFDRLDPERRAALQADYAAARGAA